MLFANHTTHRLKEIRRRGRRREVWEFCSLFLNYLNCFFLTPTHCIKIEFYICRQARKDECCRVVLCKGCYPNLGHTAGSSRRARATMTDKTKDTGDGCAHNISSGFHKAEHSCYILTEDFQKQCLRCKGRMEELMYSSVWLFVRVQFSRWFVG